MQLAWLLRGLRTGVVTTWYPRRPESLPRDYRGRPVLDATRCRAASGCAACAAACLPGAIRLDTAPDDASSVRVILDYGACVMCGLCVTACPNQAVTMSSAFELAVRRPQDLVFTVDLGGEHTNGAVSGDLDARRR